jgi:hypothetical protein
LQGQCANALVVCSRTLPVYCERSAGTMVYIDPRPELKSKRSCFGPQCESNKGNAAAFGFGTSDRRGAAKIFLTKEHAKAESGHESPGPVYELKSSVGKQMSSKNESPPAFSFGTSDRFEKLSAAKMREVAPGPGQYKKPGCYGNQCESHRRNPEHIGFGTATRKNVEKQFISHEHSKGDGAGKHSPGPAGYGPGRPSVGIQHESKKANSETTVFTTAPRFATSKRSAGDMPGPGQYNAMNSVGPQHLSKNKNIPHVAFSQSKRENREKVYISHDHEKSRFGANSPGPALVGGRSSIGKQASSKNSSPAAFSFGTSRRFAADKHDKVPGPGAYD